MRLLVLDATGDACAVALIDDGAEIAARIEPMARGHAERLTPLVAETLATAGRAPRHLDAIAVCTGPSGFTGARIGVALARGLALALGAPAVGVDWLEALGAETRGAVVAALPAAGGWAVQRFRDGAPLAPPRLLPEDDPARHPAPGETSLGPDARAGGLGPLARAATRRLAAGPVEPPGPLYLRPPDAQPARRRG